MDEIQARHVIEAAAALRRLLESEAGDVAGLPRPPAAVRPAEPAAAPGGDRSRAPSGARPAAPVPPGDRPLAPARPPIRTGGEPAAHARPPAASDVPRYGAPFTDSAADVPGDLAQIAARVETCTLCSLHQSRTRTVFGEGQAVAPTVMFVGEGPGADEDRTGRPFVGPAGQLLDKMIAAMGLRREDCYIANVVKCRPPENATPLPDQVGTCLPYLQAQIRLIRPRFLVALGASAARALTGSPDGVARQRGRVLRYGDIPLVVTYHPAALLRNPDYKRPTWTDLQMVMARLRDG